VENKVNINWEDFDKLEHRTEEYSLATSEYDGIINIHTKGGSISINMYSTDFDVLYNFLLSAGFEIRERKTRQELKEEILRLRAKLEDAIRKQAKDEKHYYYKPDSED
jgi:hypothetical protein